MPELRFSQQLALLPFTVPEYILDFLEGVEHADPFGQEKFLASMSAEYLAESREKISQVVVRLKETIGSKITSVQIEAFGKELPNIYWCKLTGEGLTRGVGFLMKSKVGNIVRIEFPEGDFSEETLKKAFSP